MSTPGEVDRSVGLPIGTRVWNRKKGDRARFGQVMPHDPLWTRGGFPVRFDDQIWETMDVSSVTAVTPKQEAAIRAEREPRAPRKSTVSRMKAS